MKKFWVAVATSLVVNIFFCSPLMSFLLVWGLMGWLGIYMLFRKFPFEGDDDDVAMVAIAILCPIIAIPTMFQLDYDEYMEMFHEWKRKNFSKIKFQNPFIWE